MVHIGLKHFPFVFSLLPFFAVGIALPPTIQDWRHDQFVSGGGMDLLVGLVIVAAWEGAILLIVKSKHRRGQERLLGRELSSWYWAPPLTFLTGVGCGLVCLVTF